MNEPRDPLVGAPSIAPSLESISYGLHVLWTGIRSGEALDQILGDERSGVAVIHQVVQEALHF